MDGTKKYVGVRGTRQPGSSLSVLGGTQTGGATTEKVEESRVTSFMKTGIDRVGETESLTDFPNRRYCAPDLLSGRRCHLLDP